MRRRAFVTTLIGVLSTAKTVMANTGVHITGTLSATEQEAQEGYFVLTTAEGATKRELMIATRPGSPIHDDLRAMVGTAVQVSIFQP